MSVKRRVYKLSLENVLLKSEDLVWREIEGEIVILTEDGRNIHTLNRVGTEIWGLVDGTRNIKQISQEICNGFEVSKEDAENDTLEFCKEMLSKGVFRI